MGVRKRQLKRGPPAPANSARREPGATEMNSVALLFKQGRFAEAEALARTMTQRFSRHGFGWKALGAALKQQGRGEEALAPMLKATELVPGDADGHNNLGATLK